MFVRQQRFAGLLSRTPDAHQVMLNGSDGGVLRNADVGHPIQFTFQQTSLVYRREVFMLGNLDVSIVSNEVEDILLKIGTRARNRCNVPSTDHSGQTASNFCCAHGTGQGQEQAPALLQMLDERHRSTANCTCVEVPIVFVHKGPNRHGHASEINRSTRCWRTHTKSGIRCMSCS